MEKELKKSINCVKQAKGSTKNAKENKRTQRLAFFFLQKKPLIKLLEHGRLKIDYLYGLQANLNFSAKLTLICGVKTV